MPERVIQRGQAIIMPPPAPALADAARHGPSMREVRALIAAPFQRGDCGAPRAGRELCQKVGPEERKSALLRRVCWQSSEDGGSRFGVARGEFT